MSCTAAHVCKAMTARSALKVTGRSAPSPLETSPFPGPFGASDTVAHSTAAEHNGKAVTPRDPRPAQLRKLAILCDWPPGSFELATCGCIARFRKNQHPKSDPRDRCQRAESVRIANKVVKRRAFAQ